MSEFPHKLGLVLKFFSSLVGQILGLACIVIGALLCYSGVTGNTSWAASAVGFSSNMSDAPPGVILFVVGIFMVLITRFKVTAKEDTTYKTQQASPSPIATPKPAPVPPTPQPKDKLHGSAKREDTSEPSTLVTLDDDELAQLLQAHGIEIRKTETIKYITPIAKELGVDITTGNNPDIQALINKIEKQTPKDVPNLTMEDLRALGRIPNINALLGKPRGFDGL